MSKKKNEQRLGQAAFVAPPPPPTAEEAKAPRVVTALSLVRVPGKGWVALKYQLQGDRVVKVEASEPDLKMVAQEKFKVAVAYMLMDDGESG